MNPGPAQVLASRSTQPVPTAMTDADDPTRRLDAAMERYVDGDLAAFDELYAGLEVKLFGFLVSMVKERARAEDLLQLVFMKLHTARGAWVRGARVTPYLFAIARNAALDELRSPTRKRTVVTEPAEMPELPSVPEDEPLDDEVARRLRAAIDKLPPKYREAIVLTKQMDMTARQAGLVVGASETAMKLRVHRGYKLLRAELGGVWPGGTAA